MANETLTRAWPSNSLHANSSTITKINDLEPHECDADGIERCKLAAAYQMVDLRGWSECIFNHITVRCPRDSNHFLINPYGLLFSEMTASSLVKINSEGKIIEPGSTSYSINYSGFVLHSVVYDVRPDINAIIHIHTGLAAGLSMLKCGLLPISQHAMLIGDIGYHDYSGILAAEDMKELIKRDVKSNHKVVVLRNHGIMAMGANIEEAWFYLYTFMNAADIQFNALAAAHGLENLNVPPKHIQDQVQNYANASSISDHCHSTDRDKIIWKIGEMEFEANMRRLDLLGYNTGYPYKKSQAVTRDRK